MNAFVKPDLPEFYLTRSTGVVESPMLTRLRDERAATLEFVERTVSQAEADQRDLSDTEKETLVRSKTRVGELDAQIKPLAEFDALKRANADSSARFRPTGTPAAQAGAPGLGAQLTTRAYDYQNAGEVLADLARAVKGQDPDALARLASAGLQINGETLTRAALPQSTDQVPGVMPKSVIGNILEDLDASRPFCSSIGVNDMGSIPGKTFSRPYVQQGVKVDTQAAEGDELTNRQLKIGSVDFTKVTKGGYASVPYQSLNWPVADIWKKLVQGFLDAYAEDSEGAVVTIFDTLVPVAAPVGLALDPTLKEIITALYSGAVAVYGVRKSLTPIHVWQSLDEWAIYGGVIDTAAAESGSQAPQIDLSNAKSMLHVPRTVVPDLPAGTTIIGAKDRFEIYEDRYGFLSAVQPKILGIDLAYGGDVAAGILVPTVGAAPAFKRIVRV